MTDLYPSTETKLKEVLAYMIDDWDRWRDVSSCLGAVTNCVFSYEDPMSQIKMGYNLVHAYDNANEYDDEAKRMHAKIKELAEIFGVTGDE